MNVFSRAFAVILMLACALPAANAGPDERLLAAVMSNDVQGASRALAAGAQVDAPMAGAGGLTAPVLYWAAAADAQAVAELLIARGADPNVGDQFGYGPLHVAAAQGNAKIAELLVSHGAKVNARGFQEVTPLYTAAKQNKLEVAEVLIAHGADVNAMTQSGYTPLVISATEGHPLIAKLLLDHGADANVRDVRGRTPLQWTLDVLITGYHGGFPVGTQQPDSNREKAQLAQAIRLRGNDWRQVAMLLIEHGADPNVEEDTGTPLYLSALIGDKDLVTALLDRGARVDGANSANETPLHAAIAERHADVAEILIERGANEAAVNMSGRTPLHFLATFLDSPNLAELMIKHGADVNARDSTGATPLHYALREGSERTAEVLRAHGGR